MAAAVESTATPGLSDLHRKVLRGEPFAKDEICCRLLPILKGRLKRLGSGCEPDCFDSAVVDALMVYLRRPDAYDATRGVLEDWLLKIAFNKLRDHARRARRWQRRERPLTETHEQSPAPSGPGDGHEASETQESGIHSLLSIACNEQERFFLCAKLAGVRSTETLAEILGLRELTVPVQRAAVKRTWDRLRKRALRCGRESHLRT